MITPDSADRRWRKSSYSGSDGGACVEVWIDSDTVRIRDSKFTGESAKQPEIIVPAARWAAFLDRALDITSTIAADLPVFARDDCNNVSIRDACGVVLTYTAAEWAAFTAGIRGGEFTSAAA
ncbi:DUF397 domain-containing protein [Nocardia sp. NBC_01377]|uniref:DUF397 domain-containing protein n=1 Tax=Nocardia sp. NBC_01377 TaxID=2903595 RepID=UPI0032449C82